MIILFRSLFAIVLILNFLGFSQVRAQAKWKNQLLNYIHTKLEKPDGGYGWEDQYDSHLTPTFAVIGILHDINSLPSDKESLVQFVRSHHPQYGPNAAAALAFKLDHPEVLYLKNGFLTGKETGASGSEMMTLIYQQIQSILWLGGDASEFNDPISKWKSQAGNLANYEKHGYPVLEQEMMTPICRHLLNVNLSDSLSVLNYLQSRRRENGSFNNAPAKDGGDGNILNTYWSMYALNILGKNNSLKNETIHWIQSCQLKNGGFTHQPHPAIGANDEVAYTWAAIKALQLAGAKPADEKGCINYLLSLHNEDGGFGNRPGLHSTPISTYYAIDALKALNAFNALDNKKSSTPLSNKKSSDFAGLKVFTVQFEAQGTGSPEEAVMLADSLHINLWGAKNGDSSWVTVAQKIADKKKVPVTFFIADEPYGKNVSIEGMGAFGHILDYIVPAHKKLPPIGNDPLWQDYRKNYMQPLMNQGGALILQISNNEPLTRILMDESVKKGGYAAISTIHFDQNFLFWVPFLYQYRYQFPFVALQDAHGTEAWWWSDELLRYRTLFLAKKPTYDEMMKALKNNWVVAVRHDSLSDFKTRILGGATGVQQYILSQQNKWKWWSDPEKLIRPWAAITIINPSDSFEVARPGKGVNVRIRCWWISKRPVLDRPVTILTQLKVDGKTVQPQYFEKKDRRGRVMDSYYLYQMESPSTGKHIIEATLSNTEDSSVRLLRKEFLYK